MSRSTGTLTTRLAHGTVAGLRKLCGESDPSSLPTAVLSGLLVVLARHTGTQDLAITESVEGGTAVIRMDCAGDPRFTDFLARVQAGRAAQAHVEVAVPPAQVGFRVSTTWDSAFDDGLDLSWRVAQEEDELALHVLYRADVHAESKVREWLEAVGRVLSAASAEPETRLSQLPVIGEAERRRLLERWNGRKAELGGPATVLDLLDRQVARTPDRTALVSGPRSLTYRELSERAHSLAERLRDAGARRGQIIGVCAPRPDEQVVGALGVLISGAGYLPLDPEYPPERLAYMVADSRAGLIVTGTEAVGGVFGEVTTIQAEAPDTPAQEPSEHVGEPIGSDDLAYVIYTSGSTGRPKGVAISHGSTAAYAAGLRAALNDEVVWADGASTLLASPFSFDASIKHLILMFFGVTLHVVDADTRRDTAAVSRYIREHRVGSFTVTPMRIQLMLAEGAFDSPGQHPVRPMVGGEAITPELWSRLQKIDGVAAYNHYGPTECTINASIAPVTGDVPVIGPALPNTRYYVLDPDRALVPIGSVGELYIGGDVVALGYVNRPALTAQRFVPDPFGPPGARLYRSGDLVRYRPNGDVEFLGRTDDQVKIRGFRIELGEIASTLLRHPDVEAAAVLVHESRPGEKLLVGYVTAADADRGIDARALRTYLAEILPDFMVPALVVLDRLPIGANGKLDRRALPAPNADRAGRAHEFVAPRTSREAVVADIWAQVLGSGRVGVFDDFFELGGHSLAAGQVVARLRDEFGVELRIRTVFESPTVAGLTAKIDDAGSAPAPMIRRRATGSRPSG
jgi:amino acid adenylation domain-containing protein